MQIPVRSPGAILVVHPGPDDAAHDVELGVRASATSPDDTAPLLPAALAGLPARPGRPGRFGHWQDNLYTATVAVSSISMATGAGLIVATEVADTPRVRSAVDASTEVPHSSVGVALSIAGAALFGVASLLGGRPRMEAALGGGTGYELTGPDTPAAHRPAPMSEAYLEMVSLPVSFGASFGDDGTTCQHDGASAMAPPKP